MVSVGKLVVFFFPEQLQCVKGVLSLSRQPMSTTCPGYRYSALFSSIQLTTFNVFLLCAESSVRQQCSNSYSNTGDRPSHNTWSVRALVRACVRVCPYVRVCTQYY